MLNSQEFEEEKKILLDWSKEEIRLIDEKYPYVKGVLDGEGVVETKKHFKEFNKRLLALHAEYNKSKT